MVVIPLASDRFEIQCHGGTAAIDRIMDDLRRQGVIPSPNPTAFGIDRLRSPTDRLIAEAGVVVQRCATAKTASIALDQMRGALAHWRDQAMNRVKDAAAETAIVASQAARMIDAGPLTTRLDRSFQIVVAGPPNVGKSSLVNALVGYDRSITMDVAGTTRDVLDADTVLDGWPVCLRDTAGIHHSHDEIEQQGIGLALDAIRSADLIIQVTDPETSIDPSKLTQTLQRTGRWLDMIDVLNKSDLLVGIHSVGSANSQRIHTSAIEGEGISGLIDRIVQSIERLRPAEGSPAAINQDQLEWLESIAALGDDPRQMLLALDGYR